MLVEVLGCLAQPTDVDLYGAVVCFASALYVVEDLGLFGSDAAAEETALVVIAIVGRAVVMSLRALAVLVSAVVVTGVT